MVSGRNVRPAGVFGVAGFPALCGMRAGAISRMSMSEKKGAPTRWDNVRTARCLGSGLRVQAPCTVLDLHSML